MNARSIHLTPKKQTTLTRRASNYRYRILETWKGPPKGWQEVCLSHLALTEMFPSRLVRALRPIQRRSRGAVDRIQETRK